MELRYCDICGVSSDEKPVYFRSKYNMCLCCKHYEQLRKHGRILDSSKYSIDDPNRYVVNGDIVTMDITDNRQNVVAQTIFDVVFLDDVSRRKWRITYKRGHPYILTKAFPEENVRHISLHRFIAKLSGLDIDHFEIDHINGDTLDNRFCNLREATRHEQVSNIAPRKTNKYGVRGISYDSRYNRYTIDFAIDNERYYFKPTKTLEEAVYTRYIAEKIFFDDVAISRHLPAMQPYIDKLSESQKQSIEEHVTDKLIDKWVNAS